MGPLHGIRIVELAAIGPVPFAGMMLADLGADMVRIDRADPGALGNWSETRYDIAARGRRSVLLDLKNPQGAAAALKLIDSADVLLEGLRPGVTEKLGVGPADCLARNPKLVYARMTGWGQTGPLSASAGHDINYIALSGALHSIGKPEASIPPLNLVGDYGGGALYLVIGVLAALVEAKRSGQGQVVDAAMLDGATSLMSVFYGLQGLGLQTPRGEGMLDGAAPYYGVYRTADGQQVALGAIEEKFWNAFVELSGFDESDFPNRHDPACWPAMRGRLQAMFASKDREAWCGLLEGSDACFSPVLSLEEAPQHPHNLARGVFAERDGVVAPAAAPRFSRTSKQEPRAAPKPGEHTREILTEAGLDAEAIEALLESGAASGL